MLDLVDEALYKVPLPIQVLIILTLLFTIRSRRDHCFDACGYQCFDEVCGIVAFITYQHLHHIAFNERAGVRALVALPARQDESQRIA